MHLRGNLMLLLAAFIWGTTFVAQMVGMDGLGPFTYAAARYILGLLFLVGLWYAWRSSREGAKRAGTYRPGWKAGLGAGCIMMVATSLQQVAMLYTTAGKTAFITALYIIFVPLGAVLLGKRIHPENWAGAAMALLGLYFLSISRSHRSASARRAVSSRHLALRQWPCSLSSTPGLPSSTAASCRRAWPLRCRSWGRSTRSRGRRPSS